MMVSLSIVLLNDVDRYILQLYLNDLVVLSLSVGLDKKIRKKNTFFPIKNPRQLDSRKIKQEILVICFRIANQIYLLNGK